MKRIYIILTTVLLTVTVWAQAPEKMSYQAVIRDVSNQLVTNASIGMRISILQGSSTGTAVYVETQAPTTNTNGLVTIEIGTGTVVSGNFTAIDWVNDSYFIKTEIDLNGGTSYTITGTSQLLSVPYALHAKTAESITGEINETDPVYTASQASNITESDITNLNNLSGVNTGDQDGSETKVTAGTNVTVSGTGTTSDPYVVNATSNGNGHYVGELFGGGIVFFVDDSGQHGLIASLDDLDGGSGVAWSATQNTEIGEPARSMTDGVGNTNAIVAQDPTAGYAATLCFNYTAGGFTDWYLPSNRELYLLCSQDILIDQILENDGNSTTNGLSHGYDAPTYARYWSSTEYSSGSAWYYEYVYAYMDNDVKNRTSRVRAVRAF